MNALGTIRTAAALALIAVVGVACGSDADDASTAATAAPAVTSAAAATSTAAGGTDVFPVTIEHEYGTTTVPAEPQRVVVAGLNEADYLYSLGVAPVGVHEWWGEYPYATGPWADPARIEVGAEPEVLQGFDINPEWVASMNPDLIVVTYHEVDQHMYDLLAEIAPVVAPSADYENYTTPWREELRLIASAVGRTGRAEEVIAEVNEKIEQIKADHPTFAGATFNTGGLDDPATLTTYSSGDIGNQMLAELGMTVPAELDALAEGVYITISSEQFELLDKLDTFIWLDDTGTMKAQAEKIPTYAVTRLHAEGRSIFPSRDMVLAFSFNTPLSIPFFLDELAPMLDAALDGDPATN
jgi:iron-siderophore transport system substrate-binding protein